MKNAPFKVAPLVLLLGFNHAPEPCATHSSESRFACDQLKLYTRFKDLPEENHNRSPLRSPNAIAVSTSTAGGFSISASTALAAIGTRI